MNKARILVPVLAAIILLPLTAPLALSARAPGPVILADLSHGENPAGLSLIIEMFPEAEWYILVSSPDDVANLPEDLVKRVDGILTGGFGGEDFAAMMEDIDMIIIGQPTVMFGEDEIAALVAWWTAERSDRRAIWFAADSDYPAQGGSMEIAMDANNAVLEALGATLRHDYVSVEDHASYAGKTYRVVGLVEPDDPVKFLAYGAERVLMHGPGAVAWVDDQGNWHSLSDTKPDNVYRIIWTSDQGVIVEHQPKGPGEPGKFGLAYTVGEEGKFVMLAAEDLGNKVIIVSGESPYGGYQPSVTYTYYGVPLDGPRFIRNILLWATGVMGELKDYVDPEALKNEVVNLVTPKIKQIQSSVNDLQGTVNNIQGTVEDLQGTVSSVQDTLGSLQNTVNSLKGDLQNTASQVSQLSSKVDQNSQSISDLNQKVSDASGAASTATNLAIVAIILALAALAIPFVRK